MSLVAPFLEHGVPITNNKQMTAFFAQVLVKRICLIMIYVTAVVICKDIVIVNFSIVESSVTFVHVLLYACY